MTLEEKLPKENFQNEVRLVENCLGRALEGGGTDYDWENLSRNFKSAYEALPKELQEKHKVTYEALNRDIDDCIETRHLLGD